MMFPGQSTMSVACARCQIRRATLHCVACTKEQGHYCSLRCQSIDTRHGTHAHGTLGTQPSTPVLGQLPSTTQPSDSMISNFWHTPLSDIVPRHAQGCSNYSAYGRAY